MTELGKLQRFTPAQIKDMRRAGQSQTDWAAIAAQTPEDIAESRASDPDVASHRYLELAKPGAEAFDCVDMKLH